MPATEAEPVRASNGGARSHVGRSAELVAATQVNRGRAAESPTEITGSGWKDIAVRVYLEFNKDRVLSVAAGVTFYTLLSLFPALAALVTSMGSSPTSTSSTSTSRRCRASCRRAPSRSSAIR
jgi:membrane protein